MVSEKDIKNLREINRRKIRYNLFRIRDGQHEFNIFNLKKYIESQFQSGMSWPLFTFSWDVGVTDHIKVVTFEEWVIDGGRTDDMGIKIPSAFTKQHM